MLQFSGYTLSKLSLVEDSPIIIITNETGALITPTKHV